MRWQCTAWLSFFPGSLLAELAFVVSLLVRVALGRRHQLVVLCASLPAEHWLRLPWFPLKWGLFTMLESSYKSWRGTSAFVSPNHLQNPIQVNKLLSHICRAFVNSNMSQGVKSLGSYQCVWHLTWRHNLNWCTAG